MTEKTRDAKVRVGVCDQCKGHVDIYAFFSDTDAQGLILVGYQCGCNYGDIWREPSEMIERLRNIGRDGEEPGLAEEPLYRVEVSQADDPTSHEIEYLTLGDIRNRAGFGWLAHLLEGVPYGEQVKIDVSIDLTRILVNNWDGWG